LLPLTAHQISTAPKYAIWIRPEPGGSMFGIHGWEWIILLVVVVLIFGPSKIPDLAKSVGRAVAEFKKGIKDVQDDVVSTAAKKPEPEDEKKEEAGK